MKCDTCEKRESCPVKDLVPVLIKRIEERGFRVLQNTEYCKLFQKSHIDCRGCEGENGCRKLERAKEVIESCAVVGLPPELTGFLVAAVIAQG
jgi:hypothetical protein